MHKTEWIALFSDVPQPVYGWLIALSLGDRSYLPRELETVMRDFGWYHIMVVSGFHLSLMGRAMLGFLSLPALLAYVFCLVGQTFWNGWRFWAWQMTWVCLFIYSCSIGLSPPLQRALLFLGLCEILWHFVGCCKHLTIVIIVLLLQFIIFPKSFLSMSTLLSWGGYLVIRSSFVGSGSLVGSLFKQALLVCFIGACLGEIGVLWVLTGLLSGPMVWGSVICGVAIVLGLDEIRDMLVSGLGWVIFGVSELEDFAGFKMTLSTPQRVVLISFFLWGSLKSNI